MTDRCGKNCLRSCLSGIWCGATGNRLSEENIKDKSSRITYINKDGTVLFDNKADADEMKNHSDRTEFQKAEKYGAGECSRYSDTLSEKTFIMHCLKDGTVLRVSGTQDSVLALVENLIFPFYVDFISDADSIRNHGICNIKKNCETNQ